MSKKIKIDCDRCGRDLSDGNAAYTRKELKIISPEDSNGGEFEHDLCWDCVAELKKWLND